MKPCVKCGKQLKHPRERHDCHGIRQRAAQGVSSEVERMKQRNMQAIKQVGQRGGEPPPSDDSESRSMPC